ncbi:MAG: DUF2059 domain-containing protein [Hyphomonadaceae bacterium]|nr:DUF2059 domain-containing protein [Hyphomonadaceae bacterium]MCA8885961.1 DUF2059 domain-containing protein [Hyphomonadaceae bacterium]
MLRLLLAVCLWLGLGVSAMAQERPSEERLALAREVMSLSGGEAGFLDMMEQMRPILLQDMRSQGVSEEMANRFTELFVQEFAQEAPRLVELGALAYANKFTDQELQDLAVFLRTPSGQAWVANQNEIAAAMMRAGMLVGQEVAARVIERARQRPAPQTP